MTFQVAQVNATTVAMDLNTQLMNKAGVLGIKSFLTSEGFFALGGSTLPVVMLDVGGDARFTSSVTASNFVATVAGTPNAFSGASLTVDSGTFIAGLGIGTTAPFSMAELVADGKGVQPSRFVNTVYNSNTPTSAGFEGRRARGTALAPTALLSQDPIVSLSAFGYDGSIFTTQQRGQIQVTAAENWSGTNQGTDIRFIVTNLGAVSATERMRLTSAGNLGVGTLTPQTLLDVAGTAQFGSTGKSTFTASGALTMATNSTVVASSSITAGAFFGDGSNLTNMTILNSSSSVAGVAVNSLSFIQISTLTTQVLRGGRPLYGTSIVDIDNGAAGSRTFTAQVERGGVAVSNSYLHFITAGDDSAISISWTEPSSTAGVQTYTLSVKSTSATGTQTARARILNIMEF
jgi:hypothetical protein